MRSLLHKLVLAAVSLLLVPLALAGTASATTTYTARVKLSASAGNATPATAKVHFHQKFEDVQQFCVGFSFAPGDAFGPGDELQMDVAPGENLGFTGFIPAGDFSVTSRGICLAAGYHNDMLAVFYDGKQKNVTFGVVSGSFTITGVDVTLTGTPR
jgi:hypothetical protein